MLKSFPHDSVNIYPWIDVMRPSNFLQYKCLHLVVIYTFSRKPFIILSCVQTPPSSDPQNKKYVTLIATMRLLQFLLFFMVAGMVVSSLSSTPFTILGLMMSIIIVYILTESVIAVVDLLSCIERNTREI